MTESSWYNYRTKKWENFQGDFKDYIPQDAASQGIYSILHQHMGRSEEAAALEVLNKHIDAVEKRNANPNL